MTKRDIVIAQLNHQKTDEVPYHLPIVGRTKEPHYAILDNHFGSRDAWLGQLDHAVKGVGGADHCTIVETLPDGRTRDSYGTVWGGGSIYHVEEPALQSPSLKGVTFPSFETFRLDEAEVNKIRRSIEQHQDYFRLFTVGRGLWESFWGIRGYENALMDCISEPEFFGELLDRVTDAHLWMIDEYGDLGFDAFYFSDDWGDQNGVTIGNDRWLEFLKPRYEKIYAAAHAKGKYCFSHCCGSVEAILPDIIEIGLDCLESVQPEARDMNPYDLKRKYGDRITFYGGLGSQSTIPHATPTELKDEVRKLADEMSKGGGYILAPAKNPQLDTPAENLIALVEAFLEYN